MGRLEGRVAIITGASRGLGRDIAVGFAQEGAKVVVAARTLQEGDFRVSGSVNVVVEQIRAAGGEALGVRCDVTSDEDMEALVQHTVSEYGRVDVLVNNAGVEVPGSILEMRAKHFDLLMRINLRGPFMLSRLVLPHMMEQGLGHILNISSRGSRGPGKGPYTTVGKVFTTYGASKAALERFTQGLAHEVWTDNVAVNALSPGISIVTEGGNYFRKTNTEDMHGWRITGDIFAEAATVMCSKDPKVFTGQLMVDEEVIRMDGGDPDAYPLVPGDGSGPADGAPRSDPAPG